MLKKQNRLLTNYEFNKTRRLGKKFNSNLFYLYYLDTQNPLNPTRVGVIVSNKFDKSAVRRNRVKRVFREVIRSDFDKIKSGFWIVIYPKQSSVGKTYEEINSEFNKALSYLSLS